MNDLITGGCVLDILYTGDIKHRSEGLLMFRDNAVPETLASSENILASSIRTLSLFFSLRRVKSNYITTDTAARKEDALVRVVIDTITQR